MGKKVNDQILRRRERPDPAPVLARPDTVIATLEKVSKSIRLKFEAALAQGKPAYPIADKFGHLQVDIQRAILAAPVDCASDLVTKAGLVAEWLELEEVPDYVRTLAQDALDAARREEQLETALRALANRTIEYIGPETDISEWMDCDAEMRKLALEGLELTG